MQSANSPALTPFHLAFPVADLQAARAFYGDVMGCEEGRSTDHWVDFNFFGHQLVAHLVPGADGSASVSKVDGHGVPIPHFGIVLTMENWEALAERMQTRGVKFEMAPTIRFKGQVGEQGTMFFFDPSHNALEIKGFTSMDNLFAK